jgi:hypothetical protein
MLFLANISNLLAQLPLHCSNGNEVSLQRRGQLCSCVEQYLGVLEKVKAKPVLQSELHPCLVIPPWENYLT